MIRVYLTVRPCFGTAKNHVLETSGRQVVGVESAAHNGVGGVGRSADGCVSLGLPSLL